MNTLGKFQLSIFAVLLMIVLGFSTIFLLANIPRFHFRASPSGSRLACLTVYWRTEGDKETSRGLSATGIPLRNGHCAVDPRLIPYGSVISINGVGTFLAVDTGRAVVSRRAARLVGVTAEQKRALVIDLFFLSPRDAERFAQSGPKFATITWWAPWCTDSRAAQARKQFKPEDWSQLQRLGML